MDLATLAVIGNHLNIEVLNPVLGIGGSPEGYNDEVVGTEVSDEARG